MKPASVINDEPASLEEILDARSLRADRQKELLKAGGSCLISFSMNIPGAIKQFPLAEAAFETGLSEIRALIPETSVLTFEESRKKTGNEAFFLLGSEPQAVKKAMSGLEESHPLGRLFDIDVLAGDGRPLSRTELGLPPRTCLVCGENAKVCARSQAHSMELVLWRTAQILNDYFRGLSADKTAACAVRALLYEVSSTPKPGLVDRNNSGSHRDMNFFTFLDSSASLIPWFREFFCLGWDHSSEPDEQIFERLRYAGQRAETAMFSATGGINTHKGLVFASAILCGALGKVHAGQELPPPLEDVLQECRKLGECSLADLHRLPNVQTPLPGSEIQHISGHTPDKMQSDPQSASAPDIRTHFVSLSTNGERIFTAYGIQGARGEAAAGFPSAVQIGLPSLKKWLFSGFSLNDAAAMALLTLISEVDDTNMVHRGGPELAKKSKEQAKRLLSTVTKENFKETLNSLDHQYITDNLSPGGCADLLAVSLMFYFLESAGMIADI